MVNRPILEIDYSILLLIKRPKMTNTPISVISHIISETRSTSPMNPSELMDKQIAELKDWRGKMLADIRKIIHDADPDIVEEWRYMGSPVWYHDGQVVLANAYKDKVKLTFPQGANLPDPEKLFNNGLEGSKWRAIDIHEGDKVNEEALKIIILAAIAYNHAGTKGKASAAAGGANKKVCQK